MRLCFFLAGVLTAFVCYQTCLVSRRWRNTFNEELTPSNFLSILYCMLLFFSLKEHCHDDFAVFWSKLLISLTKNLKFLLT